MSAQIKDTIYYYGGHLIDKIFVIFIFFIIFNLFGQLRSFS